jgi:glycosyltransferase involved in cell wall biosynthesis
MSLEPTKAYTSAGFARPRDSCFAPPMSLDTGFVNHLPALSAAGGVLPSEHKPWGLAVNEAMCASLPVAVSHETGCAVDLVRDGVNGYTPAAGGIDGLARALRRRLEDEDLRRRQGWESLARILKWAYQQCLEGIRSALADLEFRSSGTNPVLRRATSHPF